MDELLSAEKPLFDRLIIREAETLTLLLLRTNLRPLEEVVAFAVLQLEPLDRTDHPEMTDSPETMDSPSPMLLPMLSLLPVPKTPDSVQLHLKQYSLECNFFKRSRLSRPMLCSNFWDADYRPTYMVAALWRQLFYRNVSCQIRLDFPNLSEIRQTVERCRKRSGRLSSTVKLIM